MGCMVRVWCMLLLSLMVRMLLVMLHVIVDPCMRQHMMRMLCMWVLRLCIVLVYVMVAPWFMPTYVLCAV